LRVCFECLLVPAAGVLGLTGEMAVGTITGLVASFSRTGPSGSSGRGVGVRGGGRLRCAGPIKGLTARPAEGGTDRGREVLPRRRPWISMLLPGDTTVVVGVASAVAWAQISRASVQVLRLRVPSWSHAAVSSLPGRSEHIAAYILFIGMCGGIYLPHPHSSRIVISGLRRSGSHGSNTHVQGF
jgi:hypothetical protein